MSERKKANFLCPAEIFEEFKKIADSYGERKNWVAASMAMAAVIRMTDAERTAMSRAVILADQEDVVGGLVAELLRHREKANEPSPGLRPGLGSTPPSQSKSVASLPHKQPPAQRSKGKGEDQKNGTK